MELREDARYDAVGPRELLVAGEVTAAEVETVARQAIESVNAELNGLAAPLFTPALDHDPNGRFGGFRSCSRTAARWPRASSSRSAAAAWSACGSDTTTT
jgi:amidase